jgi:hypothetical protein
MDLIPLSAGELVVGCVTEDNPKYLGQTLRLVQSIRWFGGELARARLVVGAVEHVDPGARRALEALGAEIRVIRRFDARNPPANRLQLLDELVGADERHLLMLDCDTLVVRDPLPLLRRDVFQGKIANLPTVTHEVFERLFAHFGLKLPARTCLTVYDGTPTIPYFNAGVLAIPSDLAGRLAPEWRRFNAVLAAEPALVAPCEKNLHQAALALALASSGIPVEQAGSELNYQLNATHLPPPAGYAEVDPYIIHYHDLVDDRGMLLPTPFPRAQERIDRFHERRRQELAHTLRGHPPLGRSSPQQIAVIGMHRSGTSLVAQLLHAMGCYAGEEHELPPPDVFNPTGYWEHRDVWALDEEILAALDATWLEPERAGLARLTGESRRAFVERAATVAHVLDEHGSWMIKDPRMALLFPIWRQALERPLCVLAWREPSAVARSLASRDGLPLPVGLALWEEYSRAMLASTAGLPRVLVSYEELIADPIECVASLYRALVAAGALDLRLPSDEELLAMIDPTLDRQGGDDEGLLNRWQTELRDALRNRSALQWDVVPPVHPETRRLVTAFVSEQRENAALREGRGELENLLDSMFVSRSWRLGYCITRLLRKIVPSGEETAVERWRGWPRSNRK